MYEEILQILEAEGIPQILSAKIPRILKISSDRFYKFYRNFQKFLPEIDKDFEVIAIEEMFGEFSNRTTLPSPEI